ncbi:hypothetical protein DFH05DRAFT_1209188 [Lentinula detonsa]|uniref:HAM1-like N-terminal domain-containing protein n=1 Tax=Lentinula detonsa TaxID=2804962 RepID=A0A9W8NYS7_9AGAR|nr:hypothetical protein DFH05DRAFT_1209188 [Lentinula detonsa]
MGLFASCIRRKPPRCEEEPLLSPAEEQRKPELKNIFKKVVHIVSALDAGKIPSQHQLNRLLKAVLRSNILYPKEGGVSPAGNKVLRDLREVFGLLAVFGLEKNYDDKIQDTVYHARCLASAPTEPDELIILEPPSEVDPVVQRISLIASELQTDIPLLFSSMCSLLALFLTSTSFRIVSSHLFLLVRQCFVSSFVKGIQKVEGIAERVEHAAEMTQDLTDRAIYVADQVQVVAEAIELSAEGMEDVAKDAERVALLSTTEDDAIHGLRGVKTRAQEEAEQALGEVQTRQKEHLSRQEDTQKSESDDANIDKPYRQRKQQQELNADRAKTELKQTEEREDAVVESIRKVLLLIHYHPTQKSALRTIVLLTRKYINHYRTLFALRMKEYGPYISELSPSDSNMAEWKHLTSLFTNFKVLLERLAGGAAHEKSLDPLLCALRDVLVLPLDEIDQETRWSTFQVEDRNESSLLANLAIAVNQIANSALGTGSGHSPDHEQTKYIESDLFHREVRALIGKIQSVRGGVLDSTSSSDSSSVRSPSIPTPKLHTLQREVQTFITALKSDRTSRQLWCSFVKLGRDFEEYVHPSSDFSKSRAILEPFVDPSSVLTTVLNDLIGYLIPKVVSGIMGSFFDRSTSTLPRSTTNHTYDSTPGAVYSERMREWEFPLPLPRVELVSDTNNSSTPLADATDLRWLEGAIDPRQMRVRILDDKKVESQWKENISCFHWCCCTSPDSDFTDPYINAEAGYRASTFTTHSVGSERELESWANMHTNLANLLTPSSISIAQWNETRVENFFSSIVPKPKSVIDAEPLLVDLTVSGEDTSRHAAESSTRAKLVDFEVAATSVPVLDPMNRDSDPHEQSDHLFALVQDESESQDRLGRIKTKVKTLHKIRVHVEGILTSLPSVTGDVPDSSQSNSAHSLTSVRSEITQYLMLEHIGYYARYNVLSSIFGTWLGIRDEGLLDLEFKFRDSNSLSTSTRDDADGGLLDIEIDLDATTGLDTLFTIQEDELDSDVDLPFKISSTNVGLPRTLSVTPRLRDLLPSTLLSTITSFARRTLLALFIRPVVLPLAAIMIRRELEKAIAQGIEQGCEFSERLLIEILKGAKQRARKRVAKLKSEMDALPAERQVEAADLQRHQVSLGDVWASMMKVLGETTAAGDSEAIVHTRVRGVGLKGIQIERAAVGVEDNDEQRAQNNSSGVKPESIATNITTLAIGVAPQLLPDKADPISSALPSTESSKVVHEMIADAQSGVQDAFGKARESVKDGLQQDIENVVGRTQDVIQKVAEATEGVQEGIDEVEQANQQGFSKRAKKGREERGLEEGWRSAEFDL